MKRFKVTSEDKDDLEIKKLSNDIKNILLSRVYKNLLNYSIKY